MKDHGIVDIDSLADVTAKMGSLGITPIASFQSIDDLYISKEELAEHVTSFCRPQGKTSGLEALLKRNFCANRRRFRSKTNRRYDLEHRIM